MYINKIYISVLLLTKQLYAFLFISLLIELFAFDELIIFITYQLIFKLFNVFLISQIDLSIHADNIIKFFIIFLLFILLLLSSNNVYPYINANNKSVLPLQPLIKLPFFINYKLNII